MDQGYYITWDLRCIPGPSKHPQVILKWFVCFFFNGCFQVDDSKSLLFCFVIIEHPENYELYSFPELSELS